MTATTLGCDAELVTSRVGVPSAMVDGAHRVTRDRSA